MFCTCCGNQVTENDRFCSVCGKELIRPYVERKTETLPRDVFYDADGRLCWIFRDYKIRPSGNYTILHRFEEDRIAKYYGVDLEAGPKKEDRFLNAMNKFAGIGMGLAILTGDSDMHETAAELYDRSEDKIDFGEIDNYYYYRKVTVVERDGETGWILFKHGFDKFFLRVNEGQLEYILNEFMKRCPKASLGKIRK